MSRETEKLFKQFQAYVDAHQDELENGVSIEDLAQRFKTEYNAAQLERDPDAPPETADDYVELAHFAPTEQQSIAYLEKALELEPDHLDAAGLLISIKANEPEELIAQLADLLQKGTEQMERGHFFEEDMGHFWSVLETRPYMRLRYTYMQSIAMCGMTRRAIAEAEEMLKLCTDDNLGVRYTLMHLYAQMEDEETALALHKAFDEEDESQMLLPLAVLYYKKGDFERSDALLRRLCKVNSDAKKFLTDAANDDLDGHEKVLSGTGCRPNTSEELFIEYCSNPYLFAGVPHFFEWASKTLRKKAGTKKQGAKKKTTRSAKK